MGSAPRFRLVSSAAGWPLQPKPGNANPLTAVAGTERRFSKPKNGTPPCGFSLPSAAEHAGDECRHLLPTLRFERQLLPALPGDGIKARPSVVLRGAPLRRDPTTLLQPHER